MNSFQSLFIIAFVIIIPLVRVTFCFHEVEEKQIYLVLVAGEPVAFQRVNTSHNHEKLHLISDRYIQFIKDLDYRLILLSNTVIIRNVYEVHKRRLVESHDWLLQSTLEAGAYRKLYSFHHIVNGFALHTTPSQVKQ